LSSPFEKFLEELSAEAEKAKSGGTPAPAKSSQDAVMSDSGLFDVHGLVGQGKAAPAGAPGKPGAKPPAKAPSGSDAVMSDSGLFDVRELVTDKKPGTAPADKQTGKPAAGKPAPKAPPAGSDAVMSDSGLFDVRELVGDPGKKPGGGGFKDPAQLGGPKKPAGAAPPAAGGKPVMDFELFDARAGAPAGASGSGKKIPTPNESSSKVAPLLESKPPVKKAAPMPTIDDNPIMSDSGLFDVREMVAPDPSKKASAGGYSSPMGSKAAPRDPIAPASSRDAIAPRDPSGTGAAPKAGASKDGISKVGMKPAPAKPEQASRTGMKPNDPSKSGTKGVDAPSRTGVKPTGDAGSKMGLKAVPGAKPPNEKSSMKMQAVGGKSAAKTPALGNLGKKADVDDMIQHRDEGNDLAEDKIARKEGSLKTKAVKEAEKMAEIEDGQKSSPILLVLALVVLVGALAAVWFLFLK